MNSEPGAADVIDTAAGLAPGQPLFTARRFRATAIAATQASHDALLFEPVPGLTTADRLRVAVHCCEAAGATELAAHYRRLLELRAGEAAAASPSPALPAMRRWSELLITDPKRGDRAALQALKIAGSDDGAIVALAQLVAFLSYQTRVVAGLKALAAISAASERGPSSPAAADGGVVAGAAGTAGAVGGAGTAATASAANAAAAAASAAGTAPVIRANGFTNETLQWRSWLAPVKLDEATALQLQVLDESHAQARSSEYYLTLIHQPLMLRHRSAAYNAVMYAPGGAARAERELAAMVVSVSNGCVYCTSVHAQRYAQLAHRHDTVAQVFNAPARAGEAGRTERERAVAHFAQALTSRPQGLLASDLQPLRALGTSDEALIDLLHAAAIFGWANRLMHNLGEPVHP